MKAVMGIAFFIMAGCQSQEMSKQSAIDRNFTPVTVQSARDYEEAKRWNSLIARASGLPEPARTEEFDRLDRELQREKNDSERLMEESDRRYYQEEMHEDLQNIDQDLRLRNY